MGPIVILGMHRSGTSALAQALIRTGMAGPPVEFGLVGNEYNPHGYFEDSRMVEVDDWLLERHGASYDNPWPLRHVTPSAEELERFGAVWKAMDVGSILVVKDPRLCVTLRWWLPAWGDGARFVIVVRHPFAVASSLAAREAMPMVLGEALWREYTAAAITATSGRPRCFVRHEDLVRDERREVRRVLSELGIAEYVGPLDDEWSGGVDPTLVHQRGTCEPLQMSTHALRDAVNRLRDGEVTDVRGADFRDDHPELLAALTALGSAMEDARDRTVEVDRKLVEVDRKLVEVDRKLVEVELERSAMERSRSWRWTAPLRRGKHLVGAVRSRRR